MTDQIGIAAVSAYLPESRIDAMSRREQFGFDEAFVRDKIGFISVARKSSEEDTSDLAVAAMKRLEQDSNIDFNGLDVLVLVTQNPDGFGLPHTSAIVHGKLGLPKTCFCFDVSLGCSGFVAGLGILKGYMTAIGARNGVIVTADPYSKVVDQTDRNTAMIFGDGAAATWLSAEPVYTIGAMDQGTDGKTWKALEVQANRQLFMNGRAVFDFCALNVPGSLKRTMERNGLAPDDIDAVLLHQGSKYIVDTIMQRSGLKQAAFKAGEYGNLVSSSVPLLLIDAMREQRRNILVSGFGVGLGWATTALKRV